MLYVKSASLFGDGYREMQGTPDFLVLSLELDRVVKSVLVYYTLQLHASGMQGSELDWFFWVVSGQPCPRGNKRNVEQMMVMKISVRSATACLGQPC